MLNHKKISENAARILRCKMFQGGCSSSGGATFIIDCNNIKDNYYLI